MRERTVKLTALLLLSFLMAMGYQGYGRIDAPGAIPASGCREGAVLSTDQFITTGFSQSRTVGPSGCCPGLADS